MFRRWSSWLCQRVPPGKEPLFINLDETSVGLWHGAALGNISRKCSGAARQPASKRQLRSAGTHVALICGQAEVQPFLPHVIIGNTHIFTWSFEKKGVGLQAAIPSPVPRDFLVEHRAAHAAHSAFAHRVAEKAPRPAADSRSGHRLWPSPPSEPGSCNRWTAMSSLDTKPVCRTCSGSARR